MLQSSETSDSRSSTREQAARIGREILRQCGAMTLMCVGAHEKVILDDIQNGEVTVKFKCSGMKLQRGGVTMITYRMGRDDYHVQIGRVRNFVFTPLFDQEGVYCDQLENILNDVIG